MTRAIAFDVDGVLIDTDAVHETALNEALRAVAGFTLTHAEHVTTWKGLPTRVKLDRLVALRRLTADQVPEIAARKQAATVPAIAALPFNPVPARLVAALARQGWVIAAVSNAVRPTVEAMLRQSATRAFIPCVVSNEDGAPKPAPDLYWRAASLLGVAPEALVVVEDGTPGQHAALAAGCRLVAVDGPQDVTMGLVRRIQEAATRCG